MLPPCSAIRASASWCAVPRALSPPRVTAACVPTARLGGQILLTAATLRALGEAHDLRLQSHGHWRLKGLDDPIELFELANSQRSFSSPPDADKAYRVVRQGDLWLPVREIHHSLPAERDAFVGRAPALAELSKRCRPVRGWCACWAWAARARRGW